MERGEVFKGFDVGTDLRSEASGGGVLRTSMDDANANEGEPLKSFVEGVIAAEPVESGGRRLRACSGLCCSLRSLFCDPGRRKV